MPNGIIIIDKPRDWTSMDVCAKLRIVRFRVNAKAHSLRCASFSPHDPRHSRWARAGPHE